MFYACLCNFLASVHQRLVSRWSAPLCVSLSSLALLLLVLAPAHTAHAQTTTAELPLAPADSVATLATIPTTKPTANPTIGPMTKLAAGSANSFDELLIDGTGAPVIFPPTLNGTQFEFTTLDRRWQLRLEPKALFGGVTSLQKAYYDIPEFYKGVVLGDEQSWARISRREQQGVAIFEGYFSSGGQIYKLQYTPTADDSVYSLLPFGPGAHSLLPPSMQRVRINNVVSRAIRIGIVIDSLYNEHHNGRGLAHALGIINGVDGLYQEQLGLAVIVENIRVYDSADTDPMRKQQGSVEELLTAFRDIRLSDRELPNDLALVHLFSGKRDPDQVIGLGWIDTACRVDGYDLSMATPFPFDMLLSAHEIAHNLGALHDDDPNCQSQIDEPGTNIMWSQLSGLTRTEFSACSLDRMLPSLGKQCLLDNLDLAVALGSSQTSQAQERFVEVRIANQDSFRTANGVASNTLFPPGTALRQPSAGCTITNSHLSCRHAAIAPGAQNAVFVLADFEGTGSSQVTTNIVLENLVDSRNSDNRASLDALQFQGSAASTLAANDASSATASNPLGTGSNTGVSSGSTGSAAGDSRPGAGGGDTIWMAMMLFCLLLIRRQLFASTLRQFLVRTFNRIASNPLKRILVIRAW